MSDNKNLRSVIAENPLLILFLGACPAMGATTSVLGALGMGAALLAVMLLSGIVIAALRKAIPDCARIPAYLIIIAGFVSIVQMLMNAFLPEIYQMLGIYIAVAAVDLVVFANAEDGAEGGIGAAVKGAVKTGLCFIFVVVVVAFFREVLGSGSFAGKDIAALTNYRIPALTKAPGGFIVYSFVAAVVSSLFGKKAEGTGAACAAAGIGCCDCCNCKKEVDE